MATDKPELRNLPTLAEKAPVFTPGMNQLMFVPHSIECGVNSRFSNLKPYSFVFLQAPSPGAGFLTDVA